VADSCCSQSVVVLTVHSRLGIVGVKSLITSQRFCSLLAEAYPLGESVLNDSTRPLPSIVMTKAILLVPDSRSLRVAASHSGHYMGDLQLLSHCGRIGWPEQRPIAWRVLPCDGRELSDGRNEGGRRSRMSAITAIGDAEFAPQFHVMQRNQRNLSRSDLVTSKVRTD
jgi:hypothetical protein